MARQVGPRVVGGTILSAVFILVLLVVHPGSLFGQATPWYEADRFRSTNGNPEYSSPNKFSLPIPPVNGNLPGPYVRPTQQDTQRFIDSNPNLRALDPSLKQTLIYNSSNPWLNSPILPNGTNNPLYQNGHVLPNWYVPSTWSSPQMNWQGVQPDGFLSPTYATAYSPSSIPNSYNPSSSSSSLTSYQPRVQTYSQIPQNSSRQTTNERPLRDREASEKLMSPTQSFGPRPSDMKRAIDDRAHTLAVHEAAFDKIEQAIDHAELARLFIQSGKLEQAFAHLDVAEPLAKTIDDPTLRVNLLRIRAEALMASGQFEQTVDVYRTAMAISRRLDDESGQAEIYTSTGWAFQSLGKARDALNCYQAALYLFAKIGDKDGEVRTRLAIGSLYQSIGEEKKALEQLNKAIPNASKSQHARILMSFAEIFESRDKPVPALHSYHQASSLLESTGDFTLEAAILVGIGRCNMALGDYDEARYAFEQARTRMKEVGNGAGEAGVIASIGELDYWIAIAFPTADPSPLFKQAVHEYAEALPLMTAAADRTGEIGVLTNTGLVFDAWGKSRKALGYYLQALQKMDELQTSARLEEFRINLAGQSAGLYQRAVQLEISLHQDEEAFELSERARARTFLDQLGNSRINLKNHMSADFSKREKRLRLENISLERQLGQEMAKAGPEVDQGRIRALQSRLVVVRKEYADSISDLKLSNPEYASFLSISPLTLSNAQQQLGPDVTVISYFTTPDLILAFVITRDSFHVSRISVTEPQLSWAVNTLLDFSGQNDAPTLERLYKWLIAPIKSHLKTPVLAVVPYGVLHDLPFAALTSDGQHYLADNYSLFSLPSVSVLPYIRARMKPVGNNALVMANDEEEGFPQLGHAYEEAQAVASLFGSKPLLGDAATATMLQTHAGEYDIVHLIAHIDYDSQSSEFPRIILGQGKDKEGPLALDQVLGLDLRKTSLVVLSGCQSQKGNRSRGDDVTGLSRAFIYAGAPSVMASLWSVDDEATQHLMTAFYTHLKEGLSKAEALRSAQIDVRQKYPHPYYWASFVLTGDPGQAGSSNLLASSTK